MDLKERRNAAINRLALYGPKIFLQWKHYYNNRNGVKLWLQDDPFLLHIPKTGGTSIARSLRRPEPGHFKFQHICRKYPGIRRKKDYYFVCRDPVERIISTYNYVNDLHKKFGTSNIPEAYYAIDCDDFVTSFIKKMNVEKHYFLRPISEIISGIPFEKTTAICFDDLAININKYYSLKNIPQLPLLHENKSTISVSETFLNDESKSILKEKYRLDFLIYEKVRSKGMIRLSEITELSD